MYDIVDYTDNVSNQKVKAEVIGLDDDSYTIKYKLQIPNGDIKLFKRKISYAKGGEVKTINHKTSFMQNLKKKYAEGGKIDTSAVAKYLGANQTMPDEEVQQSIAEKIKRTRNLYEQDGKGKNAVVYMHYFNPSSDWYVTEMDKSTGQMFGYVILNGDRQNSEFGYWNIEELMDKEGLSSMLVPELDYYWNLKTLNETFRNAGYVDLIEGEVENWYAKGGEVEENRELSILKPTNKVDVEVVETSDILKHKFANDFEKNLAIRELLDQKLDNPNSYSVEEKLFIGTYTGMGGLEKYGATGKGLLYEFYTPKDVIKKMWGLAYKHRKDIEIKDVLEPSVGTGNFVGYAPSNVHVDGYDIDKYAIWICRVLYPQENRHFSHKSFETNFMASNNTSIKDKTKHLELYDLVIGNPPYGKYSGLYAGMGEKKYTHAKDFIDYFILRGLDMLKPNGLLVFVIGTLTQLGGVPFLDKKPSKVRSMIMKRANLVDAYRLGIGIFNTTDVDSDIIVLRKK